MLRVPSSLIDNFVRQCDGVCCRVRLPSCPVLCRWPRRRQGSRYRLGFLLAVAVLVVLDGAKSLVAIAQWASTADLATIAVLGGSAVGRPMATTIERAFDGIDGDALDDTCFGWINALLAESAPDTATVLGLGVDRKTVRGAKNADGPEPHLVAALRHDGETVAGQRRVADGGWRRKRTRSRISSRRCY